MGGQKHTQVKPKIVFTISLLGLMIAGFVATSGSFLVRDDARSADVIVVLAGETESRPARGLELLKRGYAPQLILDVPAEARIYGRNQIELAREYVQGFSNGLPKTASITVCPIFGLSTKAEVNDVQRCLPGRDVKQILLVTSDFHTRRALSIFTCEARNLSFTVAAAYDTRRFAPQWWRNREWAKTNVDEWLRLVWWELIDQWR